MIDRINCYEPFAAALAMGLCLLLGACSSGSGTDDTGAAPREVVFDSLQTLVSYETDALASSADLDLLPSGELAVLDPRRGEVRVYSAGDGTFRRAFGNTGNGPGEFSRPMYLFPSDTALHVVDQGAARITSFNFDGSHLSTLPVQMGFMASIALPVGPRSYITPTGGLEESLVKYQDLDRDTARYYGKPVEGGSTKFDPEVIVSSQKEAQEGRVPAVYRNRASLRYEDGSVYLLLESYPRLLKFSLDGEKQWDVLIEHPVLDAIFRSFVEMNRDADPRGLPVLQMIIDFYVAGGETWLLTYRSEDREQFVIKVDREGRVTDHYTIPVMEETFLTDILADPGTGRLYLNAGNNAVIYRTALPE